jgi:hypothetical protein
MKRITTIITSFALLAGLTAAVPVLVPTGAHAATNPNSQALCEGSGGTWAANSASPTGGSCSNGEGSRTVPGTIQQITDVLVFLVGAVSVLMIIIGGVRYVTSNGEQAGTKSAKDTILYAIIGLVVAFMAYAIVHFIVASFNIK